MGNNASHPTQPGSGNKPPLKPQQVVTTKPKPEESMSSVSGSDSSDSNTSESNSSDDQSSDDSGSEDEEDISVKTSKTSTDSPFEKKTTRLPFLKTNDKPKPRSQLSAIEESPAKVSTSEQDSRDHLSREQLEFATFSEFKEKVTDVVEALEYLSFTDSPSETNVTLEAPPAHTSKEFQYQGVFTSLDSKVTDGPDLDSFLKDISQAQHLENVLLSEIVVISKSELACNIVKDHYKKLIVDKKIYCITLGTEWQSNKVSSFPTFVDLLHQQEILIWAI